MANLSDRRDHERIELQMPTRLWLDEKHHGKHITFEGHARTSNLAIGGTFLQSSYLLAVGFPINLEISLEDRGEVLSARGQVTHKLGENDALGPGMGVLFTAVDEENRERLLRFFVSDRIRNFYQERFLVEFPQLRDSLSLKDVALIVNLWEDRDGRLTSLREGSNVTAAAPATLPNAVKRPRASR